MTTSITQREVREWFEQIGHYRVTLQRLHDRRESLESPLHSTSQLTVGGSGVGDPTARAAMALISAREDEESTERALMREIERCRRVCDGIKKAIDKETGAILEDHYIGGLTWSAVAQAMRISEPTVYRKRNIAFDWIATVGLARAEDGMTIGEWIENRVLPAE